MKVLFLSYQEPASYGSPQLRCNQPAQYLRASGFDAQVKWLYEPFLDKPDLIIASRVINDNATARIFDRARSHGAIIVYDCDDLIFHESAAPYLKVVNKRGHDRLITSRFEAMRATDCVIVSTDTLREIVASQGLDARVMRNGLSADFLELAHSARTGYRCEDDERLVLGYFSGSSTHDRDFAVIAGVLARLLTDHGNVHLLTVGPLTLPAALKGFRDRVVQRPSVPYLDLPALIASVDLNLAPLQIFEPFCRSKSELKYTEAAACGVATLATATPPFANAIRHGETGFLAKTEEDWSELLTAATEEKEKLRRMGRRAQGDIQKRYSPEALTKEWEALVEQLFDLKLYAAVSRGSRVMQAVTDSWALLRVLRHKLNKGLLLTTKT